MTQSSIFAVYVLYRSAIVNGVCTCFTPFKPVPLWTLNGAEAERAQFQIKKKREGLSFPYKLIRNHPPRKE